LQPITGCAIIRNNVSFASSLRVAQMCVIAIRNYSLPILRVVNACNWAALWSLT